jgi:hypothetical protein
MLFAGTLKSMESIKQQQVQQWQMVAAAGGRYLSDALRNRIGW